MNDSKTLEVLDRLPIWVPTAVRRYLRHTQAGLSLRDVARDEGCHASTVLRQVRRFENLRDDPLVDEALESLGRIFSPSETKKTSKGNELMIAQARMQTVADEAVLEREARRILRRLCETGAVLALAPNMDKAVVLRGKGDEAPTRTAVVARDVAQAFVLKDWISCAQSGRVATYRITAAGRSALKKFIAEDEAKRRSRIDSQEVANFAHEERDVIDPKTGALQRVRYNIADSPLAMLARRKDRNGIPFLGADLVQAGERFREDFELAQMGPGIAQNWDRFLLSSDRDSMLDDAGMGEGSRAARARVLQALEDLGPGLGDIVMRCCCFLEGLEAAEKRLGWSARSGKVVLRIGLQRLRRHYEETHGVGAAMIG